MKPENFEHPDDYSKAFAKAFPGYFPTYFSSLQCGWKIERETEKAVLIDWEVWLPKSVCLIENKKVFGIKSAFYKRLVFKASRRFA
jgi:hypothetical protein